MSILKLVPPFNYDVWNRVLSLKITSTSSTLARFSFLEALSQTIYVSGSKNVDLVNQEKYQKRKELK